MATFQGVEVNDASTAKLKRMLQNAYKQIVSEINGATSFGVANRQAILAQIDAQLTALGVDVNQFIKDEIPQYYRTGADQSVSQLQKIGAFVSIDKGFNKVHLQAIAALASDTQRSFAGAISGVSRSAHNLLGTAVKQQILQNIATGMAQGSATRTVALQIKGTLADEGLSALRDKAGKNWDLDTYGAMLYRTKVVEARNTGFINRLAQNGYDLAQVSTHMLPCKLCQPWQGVIVSVTGNTPGYPTLTDAEEGGLFHPNCEHAVNVISDLSTQTLAYNINTGQYEEGGGIDASLLQE